jgi:hypothetical protein
MKRITARNNGVGLRENNALGPLMQILVGADLYKTFE